MQNNDQLQQQIMLLQNRLDALESKAVNLFDIFGGFQVVSVAPSGIPVSSSPYDQIKIYINSTTYKLYVFDNVNNVWHNVTLT